MHCLLDRTVITQHLILQIIVVIFSTTGKFGRHKQAFIPFIRILSATYKSHIRRAAISIRILIGTVITASLRMLGRSIYIQTMLIIFREEIELQPAPIDIMLRLLGYIRFMRRQIQ